MTGVLGEVSLKRELILPLKSSVLHFNTYNGNSPVQPISENVIHQNDKYNHKIFPNQFTYVFVNSYKIILFDDVHCLVQVLNKFYITKSQENFIPWSFRFLHQKKSSILRTGPKKSNEIHNIPRAIGKNEINREKAQKV
jgi:hypothetical protein